MIPSGQIWPDFWPDLLSYMKASQESGQISKSDLTWTDGTPQRMVKSKGNPRKFQGNLGWWNIIPFGQKTARNHWKV